MNGGADPADAAVKQGDFTMSSDEPIVYIKGAFVAASKAHVSIYDLGIVLGASVTDFTRTFNHDPFRLEDHIARLYRAMKYCRIDIGFDPEKMHQLTMQVVSHNVKLIAKEDELGILHFVTPGEKLCYAGSAGPTGKTEPTVCIHTFPLPFYLWKKYYTDGARVAVPSTRHVPPVCVDPKMKNRSRLHWWIAECEARQIDPESLPLLLDLQGNITESSGANFMVVCNGTVQSPTTANTLPGIGREVVKELCAELSIPFIERDLQLYDVVNADEAFLSTTPYCIAPVTHVNHIQIGKGIMGPVAKRLLAAWSKKVNLDIVKQITSARSRG